MKRHFCLEGQIRLKGYAHFFIHVEFQRSGLVSARKHFDKRQEASLDIATEEKIPSESLDLGGRGTDTEEVGRC